MLRAAPEPLIALALLGLATLAFLYLTAPTAGPTDPADELAPLDEARELLEALSQLRQAHGCPPIDVEADLHDLYAPGRLAPPDGDRSGAADA